MADALLVAGPAGLSAHPDRAQLLAGSGFLAAAAAAPMAPVQLWARVGAELSAQHREILTRRRVDIAGLGDEGATPRLPAVSPSERYLPEIEPVDASELGAVLVLDLPPAECDRAITVARQLPDAAGRPLLLAPPVGTDGPRLKTLAAGCDLLLLSVAEALRALGGTDPVACGRALIEAGATTVLLSAGPFGGLSFYKQKVVSWPSTPRETGAEGGMARAIFAGVLAAQVAGLGRIDYRHLKRFLATASAVACDAARSDDPKRLMGLKRDDYQQLFLRLRRNAKY
jgi:hypothetical protein